MPDPVSWLVIERGWDVVDARGRRVGEVQELIGDTGSDIFNGLAVNPGLLKAPRYVPSEQVARIEEGVVHLSITADEFERLEEFEEPPASEQFRPD